MSTEDTLLAVAMNLTRMGNWAADDYRAKQKLIITFMEQTSSDVATLRSGTFGERFGKTFAMFDREFRALETEARDIPINTNVWAEKMMTWGNILTHRAKLLRD